MGYKDITQGEKTARILQGRFIKSPAKGTPGVEISFEFEEPSTGGLERLNWVGWLSEKAMPFTMKTLVNVLGFNGNDSVDESSVLTDPEVFDFKRQVKLVVEPEAYVNNEGEEKVAMKIKYVNPLGGSAFGAIEPQSIKSELAATGFRAAFLAEKKQVAKPEVPF